MPARLNKRHDDQTRSAIQTTQIVKRLTDHILDEVEMTSTQVNAALGLLKKTLPDLKVMDLGNADDTGLIINVHKHAGD